MKQPVDRILVSRTDRLARFLEAADVDEQLRTLPAALGELNALLADVVHRIADQVDAAAAALQALEELRDRAWALDLAAGQVGAPQTSALAGDRAWSGR